MPHPETSSPPTRSIVLCKWHPILAAELVGRSSVHVVLDDFDVAHGAVDEVVLGKAASVHRVSSFTALEELATVGVSIRLLDETVADVVSHTEFSQLGAGYLREVLGLGGVDVARSVATRDKRWMKQVLRSAGIAAPAFHTLHRPADADAVAALAAELDFPVVIKPAAGFGTMSTYRADDAEEFAEVCRTYSYEPALSSRELTVESFQDGEELHVDAYWGEDGPQFFFVSRYFAPRLAVQRGECEQDGGELLSREAHPELYAAVEPFVGRVMASLKLSNTIIHLELFQTAEGELVFSEIASRVGGGWIPGLVSQALGRSVWQVLADLAVDGHTAPPDPVAPFIGVLHLRPRAPGRIVQIPTADEIGAVPGVVEVKVWKQVGDVLAMRHPSEWVVFAFLGADTSAELITLSDRVARLLEVRTEPVEAHD